MAEQSRIEKSKNNFIFSLLYNLVITAMGFATRTVFVHSLGTDYLGLNGLFSNVLSILSLAELGIGNAITFSLYKPIAEKDREKIKSLLGLYKKAYYIIGWFVLLMGVGLTPFLKYIVNLDVGVTINYYAIYYLFLFNSVVSYWFFAYRSVIIYANQQQYVLAKVETVFALIRSLIQFAVLFFLRNYYVYLLLPILLGILKNGIISRIAGETFPIINERNVEPLDKEETKTIFQNVYALLLFKISGIVYGATDNIVISTYLGTKVVGLVSNYTMIIQLVGGYVSMVFQSLYASVGNLNATESDSYKYVVFQRISLLNYWIYSYSAICLGAFLNPCIRVWLGGSFCLSDRTVWLLSLVFFVPGLNNVINIYKDACGLFKEVQYRALATAIVNLVVSVILVKHIGLDGVFVGTIVAYLTTIYQVDPKVVFTKIFHLPTKLYYYDLMRKICLFGILYTSIIGITKQINISGWGGLFALFLAVSICIQLILFAIYRNSEEYKYLEELALFMIHKMMKRIGGIK